MFKSWDAGAQVSSAKRLEAKPWNLEVWRTEGHWSTCVLISTPWFSVGITLTPSSYASQRAFRKGLDRRWSEYNETGCGE